MNRIVVKFWKYKYTSVIRVYGYNELAISNIKNSGNRSPGILKYEMCFVHTI